MYKAQQGDAAAAGAQAGADMGASAGEQSSGDDKVVDADFEEVK